MIITYKLGFLGAGNMASALISGILSSGFLSAGDIAVFDPSAEACAKHSAAGLAIKTDEQSIVCECEYIVIAVKPQIFGGLLEKIKASYTPDKIIISIAAGISGDYIKSYLGEAAKVVLVMPNTPLMIGQGATALSALPSVLSEELDFAASIFGSCGHTEIIPCDKMNEIIPVNGSSPAIIYLLADIFSKTAEKYGIDFDTANRLFCQTLIGSANMMLSSGKPHNELIAMVTSPGGTTFKALESLEADGIDKIIGNAFKKCIDRAYELGQS